MTDPQPDQDLRTFEIPGHLAIMEGNGDLPKLELTTARSRAEIYLHGAHITDFQKRGEEPLLFTSRCSRFQAGQPIRGGIPVIFPWFGSREGEAAHGFARLVTWRLHEAVCLPADGLTLRFGLPEVPAQATWPAFSANYVVTLTDRLHLELLLTNRSPDQTLVCENCLHTYFNISDIQAVRIAGLKGTDYLDKTLQFARRTEEDDQLAITAETDRIYLDTTGPVEFTDPGFRRRVCIEKSGSASTVVWNPGAIRSQAMPDLCNDDYLRMLCIESGNVAGNRLSIPPGHTAVLAVTYSTTTL